MTTGAAPSEVWPEEAWPTMLAAASIEPTDVWPTETHPTQLALAPGDPTEVSATEPEPPSDDPVPLATASTPYAWKPSEPEPLSRWRSGVGVGFALGLAAMVMARRGREH